MVEEREREATLELLREHYAEGRLTLEEFSDRLSEALTAETRPALRATLRELPVPVERPRPERTRRWVGPPRPLVFVGGALAIGSVAHALGGPEPFAFVWILGGLAFFRHRLLGHAFARRRRYY
jgi:hypothetical protein